MKWIKTDSGYQTECGRGKIVKEIETSGGVKKCSKVTIWVPYANGYELDFAEERLKDAKDVVERKLK
jgi:hypothetical protein